MLCWWYAFRCLLLHIRNSGEEVKSGTKSGGKANARYTSTLSRYAANKLEKSGLPPARRVVGNRSATARRAGGKRILYINQ